MAIHVAAVFSSSVLASFFSTEVQLGPETRLHECSGRLFVSAWFTACCTAQGPEWIQK